MSDSIDSIALRRATTFAVLPWVAGASVSSKGSEWAYVAGLFGVMLTFYFAHLYFRRMQCSLLEWFVSTILFATVSGLTLSTPGVLQSPILVVLLLPLLAGWILYASIRAVVTANLLKFQSTVLRTVWFLLHVLLILSPALIFAGAIIRLGDFFPWMRGREFTPFGLPLILTGAVGVVVDVLIRIRVKRAARIALAAAKYAQR